MSLNGGTKIKLLSKKNAGRSLNAINKEQQEYVNEIKANSKVNSVEIARKWKTNK